MSLKILIVDDEKNIRTSLSALLKEQGNSVDVCESGERAIEILKHQSFHVIFLDVKLPGMDGLQVLDEIQKIVPEMIVIMISGHADLSIAVQAAKKGAYNFFEKPLNPEKIILEITNISKTLKTRQELKDFKRLADYEYQMVGVSSTMEKLRQDIKKIAPTNGRVLIYGDNGTGKELVAREIHLQSFRRNKTFVKLNCAAIPKELIESELFGHEKGAFTGALQRKIGMIEEADGGTLFLDEIGDMALDTQAKLLRVLQENEFQRVGSNKPLPFDVRIISATNKNLQQEITNGTFREDLFFRLNVVPIKVPSLNERKEDIPLLVRHFLRYYSLKNNKKEITIEEKALIPLFEYNWPGNIRELKNVIERCAILSDNDTLTFADISNQLTHATTESHHRPTAMLFDYTTGSLRDRLFHFEKYVLQLEYNKYAGNVSRMAENLDTDRPNLHRKLKKYQIK